MSWIACGKDKIDLPKEMKILFKEFEVKKLDVVGGASYQFVIFGCISYR